MTPQQGAGSRLRRVVTRAHNPDGPICWQSSLLRLILREGQPAETAIAVIRAVAADPRHEFWPDDVSYHDVPAQGVIGDRQVTDAYLAQLARSRGGRLASFDKGLAELHHDVVDLVPAN